MQGTVAVFFQLSFIAVYCLILGVFVHREAKSRKWFTAFIVSVMLLGGAVLLLYRFVNTALWYTRLVRLDSTQIASIEIDGLPVADSAGRQRIISTLKQVEWFECNHCSAREDHLLVIRCTDRSSYGFYFGDQPHQSILMLPSYVKPDGDVNPGLVVASLSYAVDGFDEEAPAEVQPTTIWPRN